MLPALILAALATAAAAVSLSRDGDLLPPLPGGFVPTATFGEIAPGIVHPGIDIATGQNALPIAAAGDGELVRVRVSGAGYRSALHLKLTDGREIVYAHLSRFVDAVEESCRARRERSGSYELDWYPPSGTFPAMRGTWLGWTGESENGRAILHVEVRVDGAPRNPLLNGFRWPDRTRPHIASLRFVPLDPAARIDGLLADRLVSAESSNRAISYEPSVILWGSVGVICESWDDAAGQKAAPWQVELDVDGQAVFVADAGRRLPRSGWDPLRPDPVEGSLLLQPLYAPGESFLGSLQCGSRLAEGGHRVRVISRDTAGNADTVETGVAVQPSPRVEEWLARPLASGAWDLGVRVAPLRGVDPERVRLWVDLTEDGRRYPVRIPLGHLGSGWFLGEVASLVPSGVMGLRVRLQTPTGIEVWEPALSLEPMGHCLEAPVDSPEVIAWPRWVEFRFHQGCIPTRSPSASLQAGGPAIRCELLETPFVEGSPPVWRFACPPKPSRPGIPPELVLHCDQVDHSWRLPQLFMVDPDLDLLWASPDGSLTLEMAAGTVSGPVWLSWGCSHRSRGPVPPDEMPLSTGLTNGQDEQLLVRSDAHSVAPADLELEGVFRVALRPSAAPQSGEEARRLFLCGRRSNEERWQSRGGVWTGSAVVAVVDHLEEWIVLEDRSGPWLYALDPFQGDRRNSDLSALRVRVRENGSGIVSAGFDVRLDDARIAAEWVPARRILTAPIDRPLSPGEHQWEVIARDRAGNEVRKRARFTVIAEP